MDYAEEIASIQMELNMGGLVERYVPGPAMDALLDEVEALVKLGYEDMPAKDVDLQGFPELARFLETIPEWSKALRVSSLLAEYLVGPMAVLQMRWSRRDGPLTRVSAIYRALTGNTITKGRDWTAVIGELKNGPIFQKILGGSADSIDPDELVAFFESYIERDNEDLRNLKEAYVSRAMGEIFSKTVDNIDARKSLGVCRTILGVLGKATESDPGNVAAVWMIIYNSYADKVRAPHYQVPKTAQTFEGEPERKIISNDPSTEESSEEDSEVKLEKKTIPEDEITSAGTPKPERKKETSEGNGLRNFLFIIFAVLTATFVLIVLYRIWLIYTRVPEGKRNYWRALWLVGPVS